MELNEKMVSAAIVAIYVMGDLDWRNSDRQDGQSEAVHMGPWSWRRVFCLLLLITLGVYHTLNGDGANLVTTFILCAGGGMAGGMIS